MQYAVIFAALAGSAIASPALKVRDDCVDKCNSAYNSCRTGPSANMATCAAEYSGCLGYLPFASNGTLIQPTACSSSSATAKATSTQSPCDKVYYDCVAENNKGAAGSPNFAVCAASSAACVGTAGPTAKPTAGTPVYTTKVVTSFTTYCPAPTTLTYNDKTYTVTEATTLTITDCPCTITSAVVAPYPTGVATNGGNNGGAVPTNGAAVPTKGGNNSGNNGGDNAGNNGGNNAGNNAGNNSGNNVGNNGGNDAGNNGGNNGGNGAATGTGIAVVPATTAPPATFTGAASAVKPAMAMLAMGAVAFL